MSEPTGFVSGAFYPRSPQQIELDYQTASSGIMEEINFGPGDPLYQLFKVMKLREYQMEMYIQAIVSGLSIQTAYGDFLDKHGEAKGIFRKGAQKAGGFVNLQFAPPAVGATYDLQDTEYLTKTNLKFTRSESGGYIINRYIGFIRGAGTRDPVPTPFQWLSGIGYVDSNNLGSGTSYSPVWDYTNQFFNWSGISTAPSTGGTYYVEVVSGVRIQDNITAELEGTGYNVGANSVVDWTNNATLPASTTVNNPSATTGGAIVESDELYRDRILQAIDASFTFESVRSKASEIQGVRAAQVYQTVGTDRTSVSGTWSGTTPDYDSGVKITGFYSGAFNVVSGAMWAQKFTPSHGIITLKRIVFRGERIGHPPPLVVGVRNENEASYVTSGIFDTYDVTPPAGEIQDYEIGVDYLDLDHTENYFMEFWCKNKTGASGASYWDNNYWRLVTGQMSGNLGTDNTGLLRDPAGDYDNYDNLLFKTQYGAAAFKIDLAIKDGYSFNEIQTVLDGKLDWVSGGGYAPMGVDYTIREASEIPVYYQGTMYIEPTTNSSLETIKARIDTSVESYVEGLKPKENVVYSKIYYTIMQDKDIWRIDDLEIYESGGTHLTNEDIFIGDGEVAIFGGSTISRG